ncbi:hypothetical protein BVI1335_570016 [Burkholderia vietnamiensis]|nr:hypothetical protein BVI1335_570016 [Burkholderia vietnamiensis]
MVLQRAYEGASGRRDPRAGDAGELMRAAAFDI